MLVFFTFFFYAPFPMSDSSTSGDQSHRKFLLFSVSWVFHLPLKNIYHLLIACLWYLCVRLTVLVLSSSAFFLFISILFPVVIVLHCSSWFSYSFSFCWLLFTCLKVHNFLFICLKVYNFLILCLRAHSFLFICSKVHNYGAVGWEQNIGSSWARNSAQSLSLKINI